MIRVSFPINTTLESDANAQAALKGYKRTTQAEVVRMWITFASLSQHSNDQAALLELYPFVSSSNITTIVIRCSRDLPDEDPLKQICLRAKTLTNIEKNLFLRSLFLLGSEIHTGKIVHGHTAKEVSINRPSKPFEHVPKVTPVMSITDNNSHAIPNDLTEITEDLGLGELMG